MFVGHGCFHSSFTPPCFHYDLLSVGCMGQGEKQGRGTTAVGASVEEEERRACSRDRNCLWGLCTPKSV